VSKRPQLDDRRAKALEAELVRRAEAVLSGDGRDRSVGPVGRALFGVAARIGEEVLKRLDQAPVKQADNFYTAAGIGRDPARPATVPVAFKLVDSTKEAVSAPPQLQLMAATDKGPVFFETGTRIDLAPGKVAALRGIDVTADAITIPSNSVMAAGLPAAAPLKRRLRSGAAIGATKLQVDPAAGLAPGMLLCLGDGDAARHYEATAVEGDLVTIDPALETGLPPDAPVLEVTEFVPFGDVARDHQLHALYLGHASLLDVPSAVTITISGANLPEGTVWSWWGKENENDPPAWHALETVPGSGGLCFSKKAGKPAKTEVEGRESLWLRAEWEGKSPSSATARDLRLAIGGGGLCGADRSDICDNHSGELNVDFEAVANNAPAVTNRPFHPFGREPRLYDSFYIGSDEAFSKAGAKVSLCFKFAGPDLGPLVGIADSDAATHIFAAGTDGLLYRTRITAVGDIADLRALPSPSDETGSVFFQKHSPVALWKLGNQKRVAVAAEGGAAIYVAELQDGAGIEATKWLRLPLENAAEVTALAVHHDGISPSLYALAGTSLFTWNAVTDGAKPLLHVGTVRNLIQIEPSDPLTGINAVLTVEESAGQLVLVRRGTDPGSSPPLATSKLPSTALRAFADGDLFVAGYDHVVAKQKWELKLTEVAAGLSDATMIGTGLELDLPLPAAFSPGAALSLAGPPPPFANRPTLSVADQHPAHVSWYKSGANSSNPVISREPESIGTSSHERRAFLRSGDHIAVQRPDRGLFFRKSSAGLIASEISIATPAQAALAAAAGIPASSTWIVHFNGSLGVPLQVVGTHLGSARKILTVVTPGDLLPAGGAIIAYDFDMVAGGGTIGPPTSSNPPANPISLPGTNALLELVAEVTVGSTKQVWHFQRTAAGTEDWTDPGIPSGTSRTFQVLKEVGRAPASTEAILLPYGSPVDLSSAGLEVWSINNDGQPVELLDYGLGHALDYPQANLLGGDARFLAAPMPWQVSGPDRAANPALSWEYWNGQSWWALETGGDANRLDDHTGNFMHGGGVFFTVPANLQPTEVIGRPNHWLRVRLVGGDYGEARITSASAPSADGKSTEQVIVRDLSAIRAPYVTSLKLGYCALELVRPEIVLTADSLGYIDQTSANEAGLEIPVFTPVGELMNPVSAAEKAAVAATEAARCDVPCPPPPPVDGPDCEAPGAYDSCDSRCIPPLDYKRATADEAPGFVRGLLLGFELGFKGNTISLYVDAEPTGLPTVLAAEMLRDGRFVPIRVVGDTSYGLTESGIVTLAIPVAPDRSELFGATAHWLRLRPKRDATSWRPRVRAIHLNAVLARSVETRVMERLGTSTGLEAQTFRLSEAPVDPESLVLRVRETLAEEDDPNHELDVKSLSLPGTWVRWAVSEDLTEGKEPERAFIIDAEQGIIRFGDGTAGRIPPLGGDILAETYARVIGDRANGIAPGSKLQLLTSLAGVDRVIGVDHAAGGSDAESPERARRRAPAKVRHGRRILTRADLEDHALTLLPDIAQVRAESRGGATRLVVVLGGAEPQPSPAALRGFEDAIREVAGYGLARPGGLDVVGPRLLPIAIELVLQPRSTDLFAEAAERAKVRLVALFDPASGNHDGRGWPLGRLPAVQDIAAALTPIEALALPVEAILRRADKEAAAERRLPESIPSDVLVRLDPDSITFERSQEAAA
jgi:predicted phage baseplate assembly protein